MKLSTSLVCAGAAVAAAAPTRTQTLKARSTETCDQWGTVATGNYVVYNDLWGEDNADSGSQCITVDSVSTDGSEIVWGASWSWSGGSSDVKSYANAALNIDTPQTLESIGTIETTWDWSYTGSDIVADVSYDMFTSSTADGDNEYEIMVWLAALGGAGPISSTGSSIATLSVGGVDFELYSGPNGDTTVFSFVAPSEATSFTGDLMEFFSYLIDKQSLPETQYLTTLEAGTEPFTGSDAVLTVSSYSVSIS
ncbi:glycoside hydrolase family 12 protein [Saccharata proteae CBS 121410]|uniref:Glycoside hydrolase family 12 protein n=1 Tax=Saccharata proteae CBS 121410 TaxID=1314787 RepID=A0A9P4LZJ8_9PEZI|nr:glycoside hydrolase family 12 protein [Saccharata proteae CBS 121410]